MARRKREIQASDAAVPLSAMIDVVFLLLIYFIVSQKPVVEDVHLSVDLPTGEGRPSNQKPGSLLTIDVMKLRENSDDFYHINGLRYSVDQLQEYLKTVAQADKNTTIIIKCGPNAKHRKLVKLLDMCDKLGLTKLNLVEDDTVLFVPEISSKKK